ncbi:MAG: LPXTG cell wall anchor domain-containing protein [Clostridia bacterium]|nr:LPXTG cell wall anchor domain-containing protein [Clostridia bacterium]
MYGADGKLIESVKNDADGFQFLLNALADGVADTTIKTDENSKAKFNLTFTEEDIGKTYTYTITEVNGGKENVTYSEARYTVTVAIELNENNQLVATLTKNGENTEAVVAEFENVYDYTPEPPVDPETPEPPTNPETGDSNNLYLLFALLFISGGSVFGAAICKGKKKEAK